MKKVFIISSVLLCLVGSFYLVYNFLLVGESTGNNKIQEILKNEVEIKPDLNKLSKIVEGDIWGLSLDEKGEKIQYYDNAEGGVWKASFDGKGKIKLTGDKFSNLKKIDWHQNKKEALLEIGDSFYFYSFGNEEKFIKKTKALGWINFNQGIVYSYEDYSTHKKTLNVSSPDGTNWKEIMSLVSDDINITHIPGSAKASFWPKSDAFVESDISIVAMGESEIQKIGDLKFGADYLWSNDGNKFLRSSVSQKGGGGLVLEVCETKTNKCTNLNVPTIASKCAWTKNNKSVYCAAPLNMGKNAIWPNDYLNHKISTKDSFWKIEVDSIKKANILEEKDVTEELDAINLLLSPNEDFLFFINKKNGSLFRIIL